MLALERLRMSPSSEMHVDQRDYIDKIARIALALERAGGDHVGSVESLHGDFIELLRLIPPASITSAPLAAAALEGPEDDKARKKKRL